MNFCKTRIKTTEPLEKVAPNLKFLEVQPGMWKCEKKAIEQHNCKVALQNKGVILSTLKTVDMSFLGKLDKEKNPVFAVFPTTTFKCVLNITLNRSKKLQSFSSGLPKTIGDGYKTGMKDKVMGGDDYMPRYKLEANFVGLLPAETKEKITTLRKAGIPTFLVADAVWKKSKKVPNPDPLVIAIYENIAYLVDVFDASIEENYVAKEFTVDPENG
jgi:hypothetical protein